MSDLKLTQTRPDALERLERAAGVVERLVEAATAHLRAEREAGARLPQHRTHALAWIATYAAAIRALVDYGSRLEADGRLTDVERLIVSIGVGEYAEQIFTGIAIGQNETARLRHLLDDDVAEAFRSDADVRAAIASGNTAQNRARLVELWLQANDEPSLGDPDTDELLETMRVEIRRFVASEIAPAAHKWHLANDYIPASILAQLGELGIFGLTIPADYGGSGLSKSAMCVVTEELSRGFLGVGSLGTRSEIAAELIRAGGTEEQKRKWLPLIASGECVPTAVFTEPDFGSDLASLATRASRVGDRYEITGGKTWITHASRANLMVILARTDPAQKGYRGLSILLAEKTPGTPEALFPDAGLEGTEIEVLGYRGMKEFELSFQSFAVPAQNLLGEVEGEGFKQLMQTFEVARIQTAARSVGVAAAAFMQAWRYANDRKQFGRPLVGFERVSDKLVMMAVETAMSRQLVYFAARQKDNDRRCDVEAGMSKLLAAKVAWASADACVQIHGGNGFALEFEASRILCDARILSIFEGAAEIQAEVIARGILG